MPLTKLQKELITESFVLMVPRMDTFATLFYEHLFVKFPESRPLFAHVDIKEQQHRASQMLAMMAGMLDDEAELRLTLSELGERHAGYGVVVDHDEQFGEVLMETLAEVAGPKIFTLEVRKAWEAVYVFMMETAQQVYTDTEKPV